MASGVFVDSSAKDHKKTESDASLWGGAQSRRPALALLFGHRGHSHLESRCATSQQKRSDSTNAVLRLAVRACHLEMSGPTRTPFRANLIEALIAWLWNTATWPHAV